jgi:hypothetical protein
MFVAYVEYSTLSKQMQYFLDILCISNKNS